MSSTRICVDELMTRNPVHVSPSTMVSRARQTMTELSIRHLPVLEGGSVVGILSERDVLRAYGLSRNLNVSVRSVMSEDVFWVRPNTWACEAAALMLDRKIGALPVMEDGELIGMITETDLLRLAQEVLTRTPRSASTQPEATAVEVTQ